MALHAPQSFEGGNAPQAAFVDEPGADGRHVTFCRLCEAHCGMIATVEDGRITKLAPDRLNPVSEGHICLKGVNAAAVTYDPDRILTPLKRVGGPGEFQPVSWDEALEDIAARLSRILEAQDGTCIGSYVGNPSAFGMFHLIYGTMFAKVLDPAAKLFGVAHADSVPKNLAQELVYGDPIAWTFPDTENCDFLIILGANPIVSHMSIVTEPRIREKLDAISKRDGVVVIDPRRTETARLFEHMPIKPDTDAWLLGAIINHIFAAGLENRAYLDKHANGADELRASVAQITPEVAEEQCGISAVAIRALAERFARSRKAACYGRVGTCRGRYSTLTNIFIESLNIITGRFGEEGGWVCGIAPLAPPGADSPFPPYGAERSRIGDIPSLAGFTPGGSIADEITTPGEGRINALFVDCGNPASSYPRGDKLAEALEQLELMVSLDLYVTETSRHAHYILPATTFLEREDFTDMWASNAPRPWIQYSAAVISPQGEARLEYEIYDALLQRMGRPSMFASPDQPSFRPELASVIDHMLRSGAYGDQYGARAEGYSFQRLREEFPHGARVSQNVDAAGSWQHVRTADGRANLKHPVMIGEIDRLLKEAAAPSFGDLRLIGRRRLASLNSWMHNVERLVRSDRPTLLIHPDDADKRGIANGGQVELASSVARVLVEAEISADVVPGCVSYPHGWGHKGGWRRANDMGGINFNMLASSAPEDWEQVSGSVHLDGISVTVTPIAAADAA